MSPLALVAAYCVLIVAGSLAGGWLPMLLRLTHTRLQLAMSFVGGAMLGVGVLHLLPHAYFEFGAIYPAAAWLLAGFMAMFFMERVFHFHHHDAPEDDACSGHDHAHEHHADHAHSSSQASWAATLAGLSVHSILDGVALGASVFAEASEPGIRWAGFAVFLAVFLHKPFDSLTLGTMMAVGGQSKAKRHAINWLYALTVPLGVALVYFGAARVGVSQHELLGAALAFAAGMFLCISTSDLLPELQFHTHDRVKLSTALLLGVALAGAVVWIESSHHDHGEHGHASHAHGDHDHK